MKNSLRLALKVTAEQSERLLALQAAFADVCNALSPLVRQTRCWNRVTLHHLAYKDLRERFPAVGSQMICNAIYAVSRAGRAVFQDPSSPFNLQRLDGKALPLMRFAPDSPVFFDRHTLSLRGDQLSMYTLDGRMRFRASATTLAHAGFNERKLREVLLSRRTDGQFELAFLFATEGDEEEGAVRSRVKVRRGSAIPQHVQVEAGA